MQGTIIENLSGKKLFVLVLLLIIAQIVCFLIGGLIAPTHSSGQIMLGQACKDVRINGTVPGLEKWSYTRGKGSCDIVDMHKFTYDSHHKANQVVYAFQMPLPRLRWLLDYSRWQQNLIAVLQINFIDLNQSQMAPKIKITLDARLAYRNKEDANDDWKLYANSVVERNLECTINNEIESSYNCRELPLFELGSLHHDYYLLNIRIPADTAKNIDQGLGNVTNLWLTAINQNADFTKVWVSLKTIFFPVILCFLVWYWRRVRMLSRQPALLESMLLALGIALSILNIPLEYLTLVFNMPFMRLLGDIREDIFYAILLSFWLVFAGEHFMIQHGEQKNTLKRYWCHLTAVGIGCLSLLTFYICERGVQLLNPFYSIWVTEVRTILALSFIILAGISAGFYLIFLTYTIWIAFTNISLTRAVQTSAKHLHNEGIIYRFKFVMITTLLCASLTIIGFILGQVAEGHWGWYNDPELEITSAFLMGVYGMWNIYILSLLCLYAPSHKQWPVEPSGN